jgi:N-acetylglucosamine-6-sulfatase
MAALLSSVACGGGAPSRGRATDDDRPNILFVLTDDQSASTLSSMRHVGRQLAAEGTTFPNFTFSLPRCCPSRASMLTGRYPHNHGVLANGGAEGGWKKFKPSEHSTVATWLDRAGYETALFGKYMNGYRSLSVPRGWSRWFANFDKGVWAKCFNSDGKKECDDDYPDQTIADRAEEFIEEREQDKPFLMWVAFSAPKGGGAADPKDAGLFRDEPLPDDPSFDEKDVSDKPPWIRENAPLSEAEKARALEQHRTRLRALQTVDRSVDRLLELLSQRGELDNTYVVFTTDNGWHSGEHRLPQGKESPYLHDLSFPLIIRGPGVPEGATDDAILMNNDLAPTFADIAGAKAGADVDGRTFLDLARGKELKGGWRTGGLIDGQASPKVGTPGYAALRMRDWLYVDYDGEEEELYDLKADPFQLENLLAGDGDLPVDLDMLRARVKALTGCERDACREAEDS